MRTKAFGRIVGWEGASLWVLSAPPGERYPRTEFHAHHAVQVTLALTGRVDFDGDAERVGGVAVAIAPDARHAFEGTGLVAHLFLAADGQPGREIARGLFSNAPIVSIPTPHLDDLATRLRQTFEAAHRTDDDLRALGRELIARLSERRLVAAALDPRVAEAIVWMTASLDQPVSLRDVARLIHLSPGRTRHLFVQQTGLPIRTYALWLRLTRAVEMFADGASLTSAAHGAGFADSAHLSRTVRRMFGINAASIRLS